MPFSTGNIIDPSQIDTGSSGDEILMSQLVARDEEVLSRMLEFGGPSSVIAGSVVPFEGDVTISANQNLSGLHYYNSLTINSDITVTANEQLVVVCNILFDMTGATLTANGQGAPGGGPSENGSDGYAGGGGGGSGGTQSDGFAGGSCIGAPGGSAGIPSFQDGGAGSSPNAIGKIAALLSLVGNSSWGGAGGAGAIVGAGAGIGGNGGGDIIVISPKIICTSGVVSADGFDGQLGTAAGGGGGGRILFKTKKYSPALLMTVNGGLGGIDTNSSGGDGAMGIKHIEIYG